MTYELCIKRLGLENFTGKDKGERKSERRGLQFVLLNVVFSDLVS